MSLIKFFVDKFTSFSPTSILALLGLIVGSIYFGSIHLNKTRVKLIKLLRPEDRPKAIQTILQRLGHPPHENLTPERQYDLFLKMESDRSLNEKIKKRWVAICVLALLLVHLIVSLVQASKSADLANPKSDTTINYYYPPAKDPDTPISQKAEAKHLPLRDKIPQASESNKVILSETFTVVNPDQTPVSNARVECPRCIEKSTTTNEQGRFILKKEFKIHEDYCVANITIIKGSKIKAEIADWKNPKTIPF